MDSPPGLNRRRVIAGAAAVGLGGPALAACGNDDSEGPAAEQSAVPTIRCTCHGSRFSAVDGSVVNGPATKALSSQPVTVNGDSISVAGAALATTSEIPVGGGTIFKDEKVVVTQPEAGEFKAFSAVCTHQNCIVTSVTPA